MPITHIHSYLVHPGKGGDGATKIGGTSVPLSGKLFKLLQDIYDGADSQCDISISFNHNADGDQQNDCRDLLLTYLGGPTLIRGEKIAKRLESVTTKRSGLGLLFLLAGAEGTDSKVVISRFPTDVAILAEEKGQDLNVAFLEQVFMKSATSYKAALYRDSSLSAGFWRGRAVDRQLNDRVVQTAAYWITDFLASDLEVTSAAGTRRMALAIRNAARSTEDVSIKSELAAAATLAKSLKGKHGTILTFLDRLNLSQRAKDAVTKHATEFLDDQFQFNNGEFSLLLAYRSIELDNGGMLTAEAEKFDDVFKRDAMTKSDKTRFTTEGRVVSERLGKSKIDRLGK